MVLKKIERKINWDIYIITLVITVIIFGIGMYVGLNLEKQVEMTVGTEISNVNARMATVETLFASENSALFCNFFVEEMGKFEKETYELGNKIGYMEERRGVDSQLKIDYMLLELRDYMFMQKIKEKCNISSNIIFYFLSSIESECPRCWEQGNEITKVRNKIDIKVYTFDLSINSSVVNALKSNYNVQNYPTLIINGKKYNFMNEEEILEAINQN